VTTRLSRQVSAAPELRYHHGRGWTLPLAGLPQGSYSLTAPLDGYRSEQRPGIEVLGNQSTLVDFTLEEQAAFGAIAGEVKEVNGSFLTGAVLSTIPGNFSTVSDANGRFAISRVPPGSYTLSVDRDGYQARDVPESPPQRGDRDQNVELSPARRRPLLQSSRTETFRRVSAGPLGQRGRYNLSRRCAPDESEPNGGMVDVCTGGSGREI
jgi:hypothetical protein